jgi:hypothetical protein
MNQKCLVCNGSGREPIPLADGGGVLFAPCRNCHGSGIAPGLDPVVPPTIPLAPALPGLLWPSTVFVVGIGLLCSSLVAAAPALRNRSDIGLLTVPFFGGLVLTLLGFRITLQRFLLRYGHVHISTWVGVLILLAMLVGFLLYAFFNGG